MAKFKRQGLSRISNSDGYLAELVGFPPLSEQRAIVRYLDYVDRRVRRYVEAKRKLIALLEEERQAVIHQAVTRGLDPNVPLKPSGVEWLGDVPAHWEVRRQLKPGVGILRGKDLHTDLVTTHRIVWYFALIGIIQTVHSKRDVQGALCHTDATTLNEMVSGQ